MSIDHEYTDAVVCPFCGHEHGDSFEYFQNQDEAEVQCESCGRDFKATCHTEITYCTEKMWPHKEKETKP